MNSAGQTRLIDFFVAWLRQAGAAKRLIGAPKKKNKRKDRQDTRPLNYEQSADESKVTKNHLSAGERTCNTAANRTEMSFGRILQTL
jgi:hypothetical protein